MNVKLLREIEKVILKEPKRMNMRRFVYSLGYVVVNRIESFIATNGEK